MKTDNKNKLARNILEDIYPLAPMQQGILFHSLYAPRSGVYFMQLSATLRGELNVAAFQRTWQEIQQRHPILRTAFNWEHREEPFQIVYRQAKLHWNEHDWRAFSAQEQEELLQAFIQSDREKGFDLKCAPLMRFNLIRLSDESYHFLWSHHHLLLDGWSCGLLLKEAFSLYEGHQAEKRGTFSPCPPYGDYIAWLQRQDMTRAQIYWQDALQGFHTATPLPAEQNTTEWRMQKEESATQKIVFSTELTEALHQSGKQQGLTVHTLLQAAWALLVKNYTGEKDVVFGTVVSGRPPEIEHIETMVGLFCNTLPTRIQIADNETLLPWLKAIQQQQAEQRQFEHSPLLQIQHWSDMPRGNSLFDSIMVFENYPVDKYMQDQVHSLTVENAHFLELTNYPLSIQIIPGQELMIRLDYDRRRFTVEAIQRLLKHLQTILETFIAHPEYRLWQVSPLTKEERQQILFTWNETTQEYPQELCLPQLFEAQVQRTPDALALRFQQQELTYAQLNTLANQLAHALLPLGVGPDLLVGLHLQRSPELVIAILAILKAGGAYLPLEPSLPRQRLATLIAQSQPHLVLTQQALRSLLPDQLDEILCLETLWPQLETFPSCDLPCTITPAHLAYVLFTSGSTGLPKGVMIPHRGLVNYLSWAMHAYQAELGEGAPVHSPLGFDLTITSLFAPLLSGRPVLLLPPGQELEALIHSLQQSPHFSLVKLTPAHLSLLKHWLSPQQAATCTNALVVGGEELPDDLVRFWHEHAPQVRIINEYGPTETVVGCCTYEVAVHEHFTGDVPIGRPIANTQLYVLDPFLQPVPPGVAGELYIGGDGLARGYLRQADVSAERFLPHPFSSEPGARLYRTGDLARYQQDGTLIFLGRIDQQVKLRGYRIELGEIENVLKQHLLVQDAIVLLREDQPGDKRLVAYVIPEHEEASLEQLTSVLQQYMSKRLPEYMVPEALVLLECLPLTANGKVDRKALPEPERRSTEQRFVAPRNPIEQQLGILWEEVLKIDAVGTHDNFFALGGHSLLLTQLATRIRKTFQIELSLPTLFQAATLAHMAEAIGNALREQHHLQPEEPILPAARDQVLPLSFAQQRIWFLQQLNPESSAYTIPVFVRLSGKLVLSALEQALNYVIQRHETLRTVFSNNNGQAVQTIQPYTYFTLPIIDLTESAPTEELLQSILGEEAIRPFDLAHELPWRARLYRQSTQEHIMAFCMHHIVSDGWSSGILVHEISTLYTHLCAGTSVELPDLTIQYADFAIWQRNRLQGGNLDALHAYWSKQLAAAPETLNLPTDYARPDIQTFRGSTEHFVLSRELTRELNMLAHKEQVTVFMLLVAAFNVLLYHYSQQNDILLGIPIANRTREETEKLIGVFMNTLVLRHRLQPQQSFHEFLALVRNTTLEAYAHQDLPFEALVEMLAPERDMGHHPLFQVMFVLQNTPMPTIELADLRMQTLEIENGMTKFDLTLFMEERADGLRGTFEYNTDLFKADTIRRFQEHFHILLQQIVQDPKELIWHLTPLSEAEQQAILSQRNKAKQAPVLHLQQQESSPQDVVEQQLALLWEELLGASNIDGSDNFFALGGHSLLLTQLASRIHNTFRLELSLRALFQSAQFASMADLISKALREQRQLAPLEPIAPVAHTNPLPLSFAQQRLWFLQQLEPENAAYNIPFLIRLSGKIATSALEQTFAEIVARHEILRTTYTGEQDEPAQIVAVESAFKPLMIDLMHLSTPERADELRRQATQESRKPFDLKHEQPIRATLLKMAEEEHILFLNLHHIASDGWSTGIIVQEVASLYPAFVAGEPSPLPKLSIQYADYAAWQRTWLQGETLQRLLAYWQEQLADIPPVLSLPYDHHRPAIPCYQGATQAFVLTQELTQALTELARHEQVTLFMLLLASFQLLLHSYSHQEDIVVGTPIANRNRQETEQLIGVFINTLVMRAHIKSQQTFRELLNRVRETTLEAYMHQDLPFETLVEALAPERDMGHHPLFQIMFVLQNTPVREIALPDVVLQPLELDTGIAKFDLTLAMEESPDGLRGTFEYSTELFEAETINRLIGHFQSMLERIVTDPVQALWRISLLTQQEQRQILHEWNQTEKEYPRECCITQLIAEQVTRSPEAIAVICGEEQLCYRELDEQANQLAHYLQKLGVGPEILVGIHLLRSIKLPVVVLGILKAGGAYMPLEIGLPAERIALLIRKTHMPIVITQQSLQEKLPDCDATILALETIWTSIAEQSMSNPENRIAPENLAYILYTSGSMGEPKGVMVPHRGLMNYLYYSRERYGAVEGHGSPVHSPLGFDLTVTSIFTPLLSGQSIELLPQEHEIDGLQTVLSQHKRYSLVKLTPAHLTLLNQWLQPEDATGSTYTLVIGGEALYREQIAFWQKHAPGVKLINEYGPTETVVGCCVYAVKGEEDDEVVPIGRPINNTQLYLLDNNFQPVPLDVPGEIYIGGEGVTRGYFQQPDLTAERYIPHTYSQKEGERLYRTGDLAYYRADGNLVFLGRVDQQVKLRGYRIELGEIENVLKQHSQVREALVIVREDQPGDKRLVAYIVPAQKHGEETQLQDELQQHMRALLPGYMLPTHLLLLNELPLTANGKVDRKALPLPEQRGSQQEEQQLQTAYEHQLAIFWQALLRVERVSANSNFFELGGHSLLLTQLATRIRSTFHVELPLRQLFQAATLAHMAKLIADEQREQRYPVHREAIQPASREHPLPLSFAQQRLWFLQQLDTNTSAYNVPLLVRLTGNLKKDVLERALTSVIARHELLRTTFSTIHGEPVQIIQQEWTFRLPLIDLSSLPAEIQATDIQQITAREARQPFDLKQDSPIRGSLLKIAEHEHILLLTLHHIASDAWSTNILTQEIATFYTADITGEPCALPALPVQYADFAVWQRNWLQGAALDALLTHWKETLAGAPPLLTLPTDQPRPTIQTYCGTTIPFVLTQELSAQLARLAQSEQVTMFMLLLSAFALLLSIYRNQDDIVIGTPIANRTCEETEQLIGVFINTLALRMHVEKTSSFRRLLQQVRASTFEAYAHQDLPFEALVDALALERNLSYHPLFQVMFVLQNTPQSTIELPDLQLQAIEPEGSVAKFDLSLSLEENKEGLRGALEYNTDLFTSATVTRMLGHFQNILQAIVTTTEQPVWSISPLMQWERNQLLIDWNQTKRAYPQELCLHELFEAQVKRSPAAIAVIYEDQQLTYQELNKQANELACLLRERGTHAESIVGICLERSLEMIIAIFGVLKAGGAYAPLDPGYPQERLAFMLTQARASLLFTSQTLARQFTGYAGEIISIDNLPPLHAGKRKAHSRKAANPDNLAYLLYTSGSTGQPKGVMISHRAICNHMHWFLETFPLGSTDRVLQKTPFSFDASVWEFYAPLLSGGTLVMAQPNGQQDSGYMIQAIKDYHITALQLVPSQLQMLVEEPQFATCHSLRWLFCGGEELPVGLYRKALDLLPVEMHNLYGPSETCVDATSWRCQMTPELHSTPIGRPIANMQAYVLDEFMQPAPMGVPGELYLSGVDLARGYMQQPELTAERFLPHPFSENAGARLYRTGDLIRYLPDSTLQYLGRIDQQVKIRGFRIESGEIEAALKQHPLVQQCSVIVREDYPGDKRLVAYLVFREQPAPGTSELRQFLLTRLPDYMMPSYFVALEKLPLLPNGKIAHRQLPAPGNARPDLEQTYMAPRTAIEQSLVDIWTAVLGIERIGINDNFFELGGDSILSIQIIARANEAGLRLTPKQIFQHQTVAQLADVINQAPAILAEQGTVSGEVALTPIQHWFFEEELGEPHHWNQAMFLEVRQKLDSTMLEQALQRLMSQHDALRMRFTREAHGWQQVNQGEEHTTQLLQFDLAEKNAHEQTAEMEHLATQLQASLHLAEGQLLRVVLFHLGEQQPARLLVIIHHLIIDSVSWIILLEDLQTLYQQLSRGQAARLPLKTSSYRQWAQQLTGYASSEELQQELTYWLRATHERAIPLPLDFVDGDNLESSGETVSITLSREDTSALLQKVPATYHTEINDVLLTALAHACAPWLGTQKVLIDLEGHGREPLFEEIDLSRTIGWFTSIYPVLLDLGESGKPGVELKLIKEQMRATPHRGIGYGILRYLSKHEETRKALQTRAQAEISFNYLGQFDQRFTGSSLFRPAAESGGPVRSLQGQRHYKVEVTGYVEGGELHMNWRYSSKLHHRSSIAQLAERFQETLQELIRHCEEEDVTGYTPSDFPAAALSQKDLDKILNKLNQPKQSRKRA